MERSYSLGSLIEKLVIDKGYDVQITTDVAKFESNKGNEEKTGLIYVLIKNFDDGIPSESRTYLKELLESLPSIKS